MGLRRKLKTLHKIKQFASVGKKEEEEEESGEEDSGEASSDRDGSEAS